jgi:hypothetical protein
MDWFNLCQEKDKLVFMLKNDNEPSFPKKMREISNKVKTLNWN